MKIGEKINPFKINERSFEPFEVINALRRTVKCMSWGAHAWRIINKVDGFRFAVQGHHHKGHVYVTLAFDDTFTVIFTSRQGTIKEIKKGIYIDMLLDCIDTYVEKIPEYKF